MSQTSPKPFVLLDDTMTLHGLRFKPEGGEMERFLSNPILLYMHIRGEVHGKWNDIHLKDGKWLATPEFDQGDPASVKIAKKVEAGYLRACSVGVYPLEVEMINGEPWATKWLIIEASIVDAGSNGNALVLTLPSGNISEDPETVIKNLTAPFMETNTKTGGALNTSLIALAAGLPEDTTSELVANKVKEVMAENQQFKLAAENAQKAKVKDLIDEAVTAGKISADDRPHYETLAAANFDSFAAVLSKIPDPVDLAAFANKGKTGTETDEDLATEYKKLDKSGGLLSLKANNPTRFEQLSKAFVASTKR